MTTGPNHAPDTTQPTGPGDTPTATQIDQSNRRFSQRSLRIGLVFLALALGIIIPSLNTIIRAWPQPNIAWVAFPIGGFLATFAVAMLIIAPFVHRRPWQSFGGTVLSPKRA